MTHLVVLLTGQLAARPGSVELSDKTLSGMNELARHWADDVSFVAEAGQVDEIGNLGNQWRDVDNLGFNLVLGNPAEILPRLKPDVVQGGLVISQRWLLQQRAPVVLVAENPAMAGFVELMSTGVTSTAPRVALGAMRYSIYLRQMAVAAAGLACNGWAAWDVYGATSKRSGKFPILFFDSRLGRADVAERAVGAGPLTLAFSGRFHPAKGPRYAIEASNRLRDIGIPHTLRMYGGGPLEGDLRHSAGPQVEFRGSLPFSPDWIREVHAEVDIMVLPHIQGDPAGTYLESAGLGVPVLGFRNRAMRGHSTNLGIGWAVPTYSTARLVRKLRELDQDRSAIRTASIIGTQFMRSHAFEDEFARRVDQLRKVAHGHQGGG